VEKKFASLVLNNFSNTLRKSLLERICYNTGEANMKAKSNHVWYLLVLVVLAVGFVFFGIKYLDNSDRVSTQPNIDTASPATTPGSSSGAGSATTADQQDAAKGTEALNNKNYQAAIDYFAKAIAENPNIAGYYSLKSQAEFLAGKTADAKSTLEAGLKIDPENELLNSKLDALNNNNLVPTN